MKILVTSDFHGSLEAARKTALKAWNVNAEVLIVCSDLTHFDLVRDAEKVLSTLTEVGKLVFFVPGNCDPPELNEIKIEGAVCIHGKCENHGDITLLGVGGGPISPFRTSFEMTEKEIMHVLNQGLKNCSLKRWFVLVSHSAPSHTKVDLTHSRKHIGSVSAREFIKDKKPNVVFCGHVHEAKGIDYIGNTVIVNPGPAGHGNCAVVVFNEKVEVQLEHL